MPDRSARCFFCLLLLWPAPGQSQEPPSLEQLLKTPLTDIPAQVEVSTASRFTQANQQSVNLTYVVTASDIAQFQYQTLAQILQSLPGIYLSTDGAFQYIGVRGLGQPGDFNSRLLFLLDGVRINENIYDAGLLGSDAIIDVENIERVEFAAGPGAAVYGNNAFFGVVNILTKTAQQLRGAALKLTLQSDGANKYFFHTAQRLAQGSEWWFSAGHQQHPEMALAFAAPEGFADSFQSLNNEHLTRLRLGGKHQGLRLQALWSAQQRNSPDLVFTPQGWLALPVRDQNDNLLLSLANQQQLDDNWRLSGHLNYNSSKYQRDIPLFHPELQLSTLHSDQLGRWYSGDLLLQYQGLADHDLLAGAEFQDDVRQQIEVRIRGFDELLQGYYGHNQRQAFFLQDQWQYSATQSLLLGARYDDSRVSGHRISPRLGWVWQLSETQQLKLLYGSAYRAANLYEFATNFAFDQPVPQDEVINSAELGYEQRLSSRFSYRLAWFDAKMRHLIRMAPDDAVFSNAERLHQRGLNLDLDWRLDSGQMLTAAWSWQQGRDVSGYPLQNSPKHLLKLQYTQPLPQLRAQLNIQALSLSRRQVGDSILPGYSLLHAGLQFQLHPQHQLVLQFYNLLDKAVYDRPLLLNPPTVQTGRTLSLSWSWQLW
jgi:iron complex outermembrane receptor protein